MTEYKGPAHEIALWFGFIPKIFGMAARAIMSATLKIVSTLPRILGPVLPYLKNKNAVAMAISQAAVVFTLPMAAEVLDVWATRVVFAASIIGALLFVADKVADEKAAQEPGANHTAAISREEYRQHSRPRAFE